MERDASAPERPRLLQAEDFEPLVGRPARFGDSGVTLRLEAVERAPGASVAGLPRPPFSLIFGAPRAATYLGEGLYSCDFGDGVVHEIHVAPIHTPAADRQEYQAIFN